MNQQNKYSRLGFGFSILGLIFLIVTVLSIRLSFGNLSINPTLVNHIPPSLLNYTILIMFFAFCIGTYFSNIGLSEPNNWKKILGIILNFGFIIIIVITLIMNLIDNFSRKH